MSVKGMQKTLRRPSCGNARKDISGGRPWHSYDTRGFQVQWGTALPTQSLLARVGRDVAGTAVWPRQLESSSLHAAWRQAGNHSILCQALGELHQAQPGSMVPLLFHQLESALADVLTTSSCESLQ
eukprot:2419142-Amphidinium_carterae.1